jgi:hypothetical protein
VRLIHPDQCTDDETRRLADLQMKRLNSMLAVLADGAQRAKYDASILNAPLLPAPLMADRRRLVAAGCSVLLILGIAALWPRPQLAPKPTATPVPPSKTVASPKKPVYHQTPPARRPVLSLSPPRPMAEPPAPAEPPPVAAIQTVTALIPLTEPTLPPLLAGRWLFVASSSTKHSGYPPDYIELSLTENAGVLHGRYQARYRVSDRAISPNVSFRFDGRTASDGGMLPWNGAGGAKGEVTLRLLPTGNLEVDWVAHQLGQEQGLISGTATLVRKIE